MFTKREQLYLKALAVSAIRTLAPEKFREVPPQDINDSLNDYLDDYLAHISLSDYSDD